jgi:hypothetical protein
MEEHKAALAAVDPAAAAHPRVQVSSLLIYTWYKHGLLLLCSAASITPAAAHPSTQESYMFTRILYNSDLPLLCNAASITAAAGAHPMMPLALSSWMQFDQP